jgi:hypothetical protein
MGGNCRVLEILVQMLELPLPARQLRCSPAILTSNLDNETQESGISEKLMPEDKKSEAEKQPSFRRHYLLWS